MTSLSIDLIGPFPKSFDGKLHILSVIDVFNLFGYLFKSFLLKYGVADMFYNTVYTPQSNPIERHNQTIGTSLAILVNKDHRNLSKFLPIVQSAMNNNVSLATGYTPFF